MSDARPTGSRGGWLAPVVLGLVLGGSFGSLAIASLGQGHLFLAVMAAIGALMTFWVAALWVWERGRKRTH